MKLTHLATATAALALMGGAAYAQETQPPAAPATGGTLDPSAGAQASPADQQDKTTPPAPTPGDTSVNPGAAAPPAAGSTGTDVTSPPASSATTASSNVSSTGAATFTNMTVTNGPVPDTPANRAKYGQPMSHAGKRSPAKGN